MILPKAQKNKWVIMFPSGTVADWTLSYTKKGAIENYTKAAHWIDDKKAYWKEVYKAGTRCIKVNITFSLCG